MSLYRQERAESLFAGALALHKQGGLEQAADQYQALLESFPDHLPSLCCLCLCRIQRGRVDEALLLGHRATRLASDSAEAWHSLGNAQAAAGDNQAAATSFRTMLMIRPAFAEGHNNLGSALLALDCFDEAIQCFTEAVTLKPDYAEAAHNLGTLYATLLRPQEAIACLKRALACHPCFVEAFIHLGALLQSASRLPESIACFSKALTLDSGQLLALHGMANSLLAQAQPGEAVLYFTAALILQPDFAEACNNLGTALQAIGRIEQAAVCYHQATFLTPDDAVAHNNRGIALTEGGHFDEACEAFEKAVRLAPRRGYFYRMLAETGRLVPPHPLLQSLEDLATEIASLPASDQIELHFALGKVYADAAQHDRSFRHLQHGNQLKRNSFTYDEADALAMLERIRSSFSAAFLRDRPKVGLASEVPVFIVGMPRSGTTLVEQILASHPEIFGAGELLDLPRLVGALGHTAFPEMIADIPGENIRHLATAYLDGLRARSPAAARITDKMPSNFKLIGLIHLALPEARIIHVRRDPLDTCLSCFSKLFTGFQPFAYDLAELGRYYRAYERLMEHWRQALPPQVMLDIRYEDIVTDLEGQTRRLLTHLGLSWHDRCLDYYRTRRLVRTASAAQVRQPIYKSTVGRWRPEATLLRPLTDALGK